MKTRIDNLAAKMVGAIRRQPFTAVALAIAVIVTTGMCLWAYTVHSAQLRTETAVRTETAALNRVMSKLDLVNSEVQQQSRTLVAKLDALRHANAMLAAYAISSRHEANTDGALALVPAAQGGPSSQAGQQWSAQICGKTDAGIGGSEKVQEDAKALADGRVGLAEFGDGVKADVKANVREQGTAKADGNASLEFQVCDQISLNNSVQLAKVRNAVRIQPVAFTPGYDNATIQSAAQTSGPSLDVTAIRSTAQKVAMAISTFLQNHPRLINDALPKSIGVLDKFQGMLSMKNVLASIDDPKQALSKASDLLQALPLPSDLSKLASNPSILFPKLSDLNPANVCMNAELDGSGGILQSLCSDVPNALQSLDKMHTVVSGLTQLPSDITNLRSNLKNDVSNLKTNLTGDVTTLCGGINNVFGNIKNTNVSFSGRTLDTGLYVVTGVNFKKFTVDTADVTVPLPRLSVSPFSGLGSVSCP